MIFTSSAGIVTNGAQTVAWCGKSNEMNFTAADGYLISEITVNGKAQHVDYDQTSYTYPAMEAIKQNVHVVVKTVSANPSITVYKKVTSTPANGSS